MAKKKTTSKKSSKKKVEKVRPELKDSHESHVSNAIAHLEEILTDEELPSDLKRHVKAVVKGAKTVQKEIR
jgi:hypothetical protein